MTKKQWVSYLVATAVPVTNQKIKLCLRFWKRNAYHGSIVDSNWTKPSTSFKEIDGRKVRECANLVFGLEFISPIPARLDGAVCARHSIFPWIQPLLYAIPTSEPKFYMFSPWLKYKEIQNILILAVTF